MRCASASAGPPRDAEVTEAAAIIRAVIERQRAAPRRRCAGRSLGGHRGRAGLMSERILVAMSGGVDSSVAAALVARSGADVGGCLDAPP